MHIKESLSKLTISCIACIQSNSLLNQNHKHNQCITKILLQSASLTLNLKPVHQPRVSENETECTLLISIVTVL